MKAADYYSSLPNDEKPRTQAGDPSPEKRKQTQPSLSPRKTIENASSSISTAVVTSVNSAIKIKDRARSFVPKKLWHAQCIYTPLGGCKRGGVDEVTPVIYYTDEDSVTKRAVEGEISFVDPFSFEESDDQCDKEDDPGLGSPAPVRLFPDESISEDAFPTSFDDNSKDKIALFDEIVSFECPVFTVKFNDEDTSIDISEAIKSINELSTKEQIRAFRESISRKGESLEAWREPILSWDGFTRSASFNMCEWDPKIEDDVESSHQA
ncbi:hypothetical protein ACHAWF_003567 [Thalassiosira exigua]